MGSLNLPAMTEMSRNGNAGFPRDSRATYKVAGSGNGAGYLKTNIGELNHE